MGPASQEQLRHARSLAAEGDVRGSLGQFQPLCDAEPYNTELWLEMANTAESGGLVDAAVAALFHVADVFARAGMAEAADIAERVLRLAPTHTGARHFVAMFKARRLGADVSLQPSMPGRDRHDGATAMESGETADPVPEFWHSDSDKSISVEVPAVNAPGLNAPGQAFSQAFDQAFSQAPGQSSSQGQLHHAFGESEKAQLIQTLLRSTSSQLVEALDESTMRALVETGTLLQKKRGDIVFREGQPGSELYIILKGSVDVQRLDSRGAIRKLATLGPGAFFGEMAIVAGAPRSATIRATGDALLLMVSRAGVRRLSERDPHVRDLLMRFFRARLVGTLMATSPIFTPLSVNERRALIGHFRLRELPPHRTVLRQNNRCDGLYMVLVGALGAYVEQTDGNLLELGTLGSGDVFGEMSFMNDEPAMASIVTIERSWILRLPRADVERVVREHPEVLEQLTDIAAIRKARNRQTLK